VRRKASLSGIREKLLAPDYQIDQEMSSEDRNGSATGMWIVNDHRYRKWVDESLAGHAVLFVNGKPGSGEFHASVSQSHALSHVQEKPP